MPWQYSDRGRNARGSVGRTPQGPFTATSKSLKERVGALKNLRPFTVMVWRTSPQLTAASLVLRLVRALLPVITLFVGKLIVDDVVVLVQTRISPRRSGSG
jgi:ATP-binding cassette, subfamily B, bacterial